MTWAWRRPETPRGTVLPLADGSFAQPFLPAANLSKAPTVCQAPSGARRVQARLTQGQGGVPTGSRGWTGRPKCFTHIVSFISRAGLNKEVL